jgi:ABC-2 type transport system permease protein
MSSLTENQIVAAFTTFGLYLVFWVMGALPSFMEQATFVKPVFEHLALTSHLESYARGLLETKDIIFNFNFIFFGLFLTFLSLQTKRWRG